MVFGLALPILLHKFDAVLRQQNERWALFVSHATYVARFLSRAITEDALKLAEQEIERVWSNFPRLYPTVTMKPKMHFSAHMTTAIRRYMSVTVLKISCVPRAGLGLQETLVHEARDAK